MSLGNLCLFTVLAAMVAFPAVRNLEVEAKQSATPNSPNIEGPPAVFLPVQSRNPRDLGPGKLLVASRELADPNFAETVILLVHYDSEGAIGLILNRRTDLPISQVLAELKTAKDVSDPVYLGGPVETPTVFALLRSTDKLEGAEHVFGGVYWISTKTALEKTISSRPDPAVFHVYLGYAGWSTDQLRNEVRLGGWFIFQADDQAVFNGNPDLLWRQMIKKTELKMAGCPTTACPHAPAAISETAVVGISGVDAGSRSTTDWRPPELLLEVRNLTLPEAIHPWSVMNRF
jgi:putative transcriptional regulator